MPRISRARGFRIYDTLGRRYLDLSRDGALLGHRGAAAITAMKSVLSQGLATGLPTAWEGRLAAALARMFPGHASVRLFSSRDRALEAISLFLGERVGRREVGDPAMDLAAEGVCAAALWRPFLPVPSGARVLLPVLPLTVCGAPAPACFPNGCAADYPGSDPLPGFLCAGALRALSAVAAMAAQAGAPRPLSNPVVERALDGARGWARVGPYVRAVFPAPDYARVHAEFLRAGVLLCPAHPGPSVLPGECSPGESRLLAELFADIPGG